jgi:hypothetical protein
MGQAIFQHARELRIGGAILVEQAHRGIAAHAAAAPMTAPARDPAPPAA